MDRESMTRYQFATICQASKCMDCDIVETCQDRFSKLKYVMKKRYRKGAITNNSNG